MRTMAGMLVAIVIMVAGCSATLRSTALGEPIVGAPSSVVGNWAFTVTGKDGTYVSTFRLTDKPAETCQSGDWFRAVVTSTGGQEYSAPAYTYASGRLELLLSSDLCDAYTSFSGTVSGAEFHGKHVSYGLSFSTEHGNVVGRRQ